MIVLEAQSVSLPSTLIYADVELRPSSYDFESETKVLKESAILANLDFRKYMYCARISIIIESESSIHATSSAENRFAEILDLKSVELPISNILLSPIGYTKSLETGEIKPLQNNGYEPSMSFVVHQGNVQPYDAINYILSINSDLSKRYLRSLHWSRNSRYEKNPQLKILFNWFAVEALLKESETDNIGGVIRWFLGFPNGKAGKDVPLKINNKLNSHPKYAYWKREIISIVDKIRVFRNDSVHSGFRSIDFTRNELELYSKVMIYASSRCQASVQLALLNKILTVSEFKEYICLIFEQNSNLINDVHGNIIFSLEQIDCT